MIAVSFARIHWQNLANFGVLALEFADAADHERVQQGDVLVLDDLRETIARSGELTVHNNTRDEDYRLTHRLSPRQVEMVLDGGLIPWLRRS